MSENENYKIEDFWPGAEELLDQHFQNKKGFGKKAGFISVAIVLLSCMTAYYFIQQSDSTFSSQKATLHSESTSIASTNTIETKSNSSTNSSSNQQENSSKQSLINSANTSSQTPVSNENSSSNEKLISEKNPSEKIQATSSTQTHTELSGKDSKSIRVQNNLGNKKSTQISTIPNEDVIASSNAAEQNHKNLIKQHTENNGNPTQPISETQAGSINNDRVSIPTSSNYSEQNSNASTTIAAISSPKKEINAIQNIDNSTANSELNSISNSTTLILQKANASNQFALEYLPTLNWKMNSDVNLPTETTITTLQSKDNLSAYPVKAKKSSISYELGAGVFQVNKTLSANSNSEYINRRKSEEKSALYASYQVGVRYQIKRWAISSGLELNQYGEKIQYSNWLNGTITSVNSVSTISQDSTTITQNYYIQGNQFDHQIMQYSSDTLITYDTVATAGKVAADVAKVNSKTQFSYIEIPLIFDYDFIQKKKITLALRTGISVGILSQKRGYYLDNQLKEFRNLNSMDDFRPWVLNARVGLDLHYYFRPTTSLFIRPEYRTNLQSVFNQSTGIQQKYSGWGIRFGLSKTF